MTRSFTACAGLTALAALTGCVRHYAAPPATSQIIVQPSAQPVATAVVAPGPPPAPQSELVPTPPPGSGAVVWQPGHWTRSDSNWVWQSGQYVPPPPGQTTWIPGQWLQQPTGGWMWVQGHWA